MPFFSRVFLPFVLLCYVSIETYLKLQHTSLCGSEGCKLAGELLRFDPLYLNYLGIAAVSLLLLLGYASLKSKLMERLFFIVLYAAIAFETTLIGYQWRVNPELCIFCFGIFSSLILIALLSYPKRAAAVLTVIIAIFLALNTLGIGKNKAFVSHEGLYLIQSETCPHCKKVKAYFKAHNIDYEAISVEEASARYFLKFVDISSIPVAIFKDKKGVQLLYGDRNIISHFEAEDTPQVQSTPAQSSSLQAPDDFFSATNEPGCEISITQTPSCEENKTTP